VTTRRKSLAGESARLARIEASLSAEDAALVRSLAEAVDPRGQRDEAVRRAAALIGHAAPSARAKALASELQRYASGRWPHERVLPSPVDASPLRRDLHRILHCNGGDTIGWRRLLEIVEA
jgi:hypothetical protein